MSEKRDRLVQRLEPYDLNQGEASVYLVLLEFGQLSALVISRKLKLGRTKVYRMLDTLMEKQLVIMKHDDRGFKFLAADPTTLELAIDREVHRLESLKHQLGEITPQLEALMSQGKSGSEVRYYQGVKGLTTVNFHLLSAKREFVSYEVATANAYMEQADAEELRRELVKKQIMTRTLTNRRHIPGFTKVTELVQKWWQPRFISEGILKIRADVFIYNDVYALCHYLDQGDVFCVEIENEHLAEMQTQLFEVLWEQAIPLEIKGDDGEAQLLNASTQR